MECGRLPNHNQANKHKLRWAVFVASFFPGTWCHEVRFDETHEDVVARDPITKNVTAGQHPVMLIRASLLSKHSAEDVATKILTFLVPLVVTPFKMTITECPSQLTC